MRPCDCHDEESQGKLTESGIRINNKGIYLKNGTVYFEGPGVRCAIPMKLAKAFAEWFLEDQS